MGREHQGAGPDLHGEVDRMVNAKLIEEVEEIWPDEMAPLVSIAISVKRIADALTGPQSGLLEDVFFHAGRAFENGRRQ
jgi:hypothetical protein